MIRSKAFFKRTRRGKVMRILEEHYLRDDVGLGTLHGASSSPLTPSELQLLLEERASGRGGQREGGKEGGRPVLGILDTNVALEQLDFLENAQASGAVLGMVILLQTVMEEVRANSLAAYRRLKKLLLDDSRALVYLANEHHAETYRDRLPEESPNDYNDRLIRAASSFYTQQLGEEGGRVVMVSYDKDNLRKAKAEGIEAMTLAALVCSTHPELSDLLAVPSAAADAYTGTKGGRGGGKEEILPAHLSPAELNKGIKSGRLLQGTLRVERHCWHDAYVSVRGLGDGEGGGDGRVSVLVRGMQNVNRALDGDVVAVEILPKQHWLTGQEELTFQEEKEAAEAAQEGKVQGEGEGGENDTPSNYESLIPSPVVQPPASSSSSSSTVKPTGRVVGVIKRNWRVYCGSLQASADKVGGGGGGSTVSALFVPVDRRLPKVRLQTRQREALQDKRILVAVDAWPATSRFPIGHYVKTLGAVGDKEVETEVLLHEYDIPWEPFSEKVMACLPPSDWKMTPENTQGRKDLRSVPVMSIDPPGCKDIDDALHCTRLPNGNFAVGVHIADVSYFVAPGSALDEEAANRSTSTYLVQRRLDMLPKLLTETLCSLTSTSDHFAFSVTWELTPQADIVAVDFCRSIIRSVAALSYQEAQNIHDDPRRKDAVATGIRDLNSLAKQLRSKRMEAGALLLASTEVKFVLDAESADPLDVQMYQLKETHALVEEFMLLANITVGKKILRHNPTLSLLRRHPSPSRERFEPLIAAAASRGFTLCVDDSRALQQSLDASTDKDDPYINRIVRILATRCMFPAQYFCSGECPQGEWHHYGLAAPIYTHFTSPIRRYADIVVHRLLAAAIGVAPLPEALMDKGNLHDLSENMNRRHKAAQNAGRGSTAFHTVLFFKENPAEAEDAYILRILETRLIVLVPRFGIEGSIDLKPLADHGLLNRDADGHRITCPGNIKLRVFDKVQVGIRVAEGQAAHRDAVLYTLKRPLIPGLEEAAVGRGGKKTGVGAALGKRKGGGSK